MSLRYRLDKERFKGKKLPPKIRTNEDHISEDQRGDESGFDDPTSDRGIKHALKQKMRDEAEKFSKRGIVSSLNQLKDYSEKEDGKPGKKLKRKRKKKKAVAEYPESGVAEEGSLIEGSEEAKAEVLTEGDDGQLSAEEIAPDEPKPKKGIFKRISHHFFPPIHEELPPPQHTRPIANPTVSAELPDDGVKAGGDAEDPTVTVPDSLVPEEAREGEAVPGEDTDEGKELDRRHMLKEGIHFFAKPMVEKVSSKIDSVNNAMDRVTKRPALLRPPGAISEQKFLQACTRCDDCINACPKDAIKRVPKTMGFFIMGTPYIDPAKKPCVMCDGLPCIPACQEGALMPVASPPEVKMGYAILDKKKCSAYGDGFCQQCVIDCPIPGAIIQKDQKPRIDKNVCTGCGVCVFSCTAVNQPVAIKIKPWMVIESQQRKKEMEAQKAELAEKMKIEKARLLAEKAKLEEEKAALAREKGWVDEEEENGPSPAPPA